MVRKRFLWLMITLPFIFMGKLCGQEASPSSYSSYDFIPGDSTIFEERHNDASSTLSQWKVTGGSAVAEDFQSQRCISIKKYYTKLIPLFKKNEYLTSDWSIEYDTWLDAGYEGNPGITIRLNAKDERVVIVPNKDDFTVSIKGERRSAPTPEEFAAEKFFNRWNHIAISYVKRTLTVYANQYKVMTWPDVDLGVTNLTVTGDQSPDLPMLFKNFRIASGFSSNAAQALSQGKLVSHSICFDLGSATLRPQSIGVLRQIADALKSRSNERFEIGGHTDNVGNAASNQSLSEQRAAAVKDYLVSLGVAESQLSTRGYGATKPSCPNTSVEGKACNRRVEFIRQ